LSMLLAKTLIVGAADAEATGTRNAAATASAAIMR
jgi:hypothetical protein